MWKLRVKHLENKYNLDMLLMAAQYIKTSKFSLQGNKACGHGNKRGVFMCNWNQVVINLVVYAIFMIMIKKIKSIGDTQQLKEKSQSKSLPKVK